MENHIERSTYSFSVRVWHFEDLISNSISSKSFIFAMIFLVAFLRFSIFLPHFGVKQGHLDSNLEQLEDLKGQFEVLFQMFFMVKLMFWILICFTSERYSIQIFLGFSCFHYVLSLENLHLIYYLILK